jgi:oxygen-independent coproporphyrinogen-3 oxidase
LDALTREIALRMSDERGLPAPLRSLYFGGGTPTTLSLETWQRLFSFLANYFELDNGCEITIEANPESATPAKLQLFNQLGATRISFGAQSFSQSNLARLGRIHNTEQIFTAVADARAAGFDDISLDLIYGLPDETADSLVSDLKAAVSLRPLHLSLYALTLEGEVPLRQQVQRGELSLPDDDSLAARYASNVEYLATEGLAQYEISNFATAGHECRHNLAYWTQQDYYAFGPAAVATLNGKRIRNEPNINGYIESLSHGRLPPHEVEEITHAKRLIETIMLSLRLASGLNVAHLRETFDYDILSRRGKLLAKLQEVGDLEIADGFIRLTPSGMFRSDLIASSLCPDFV